MITPKLIYVWGNLFTPQPSKLQPDKPVYALRGLVTRAAIQDLAWAELEAAIQDAAAKFGGASWRHPYRTDVAGRGWPDDVVGFINAKSGAEFKPAVIGADGLPVMDPAAVYPGITCRFSYRVFTYGGAGQAYQPGVSIGLQNFQKLADGPRLKTARGDGSEFGRFNPSDDDIFN